MYKKNYDKGYINYYILKDIQNKNQLPDERKIRYLPFFKGWESWEKNVFGDQPTKFSGLSALEISNKIYFIP